MVGGELSGGRSEPGSRWIDTSFHQSAAVLGLNRRSSRAGLDDASAERDPHTHIHSHWLRSLVLSPRTHTLTFTYTLTVAHIHGEKGRVSALREPCSQALPGRG